MGKKPWTAERRWQSLIEKGIVETNARPDDLDALGGRLSAALSPTMYDESGVRSADARALFEAFVDELYAQIERGIDHHPFAPSLELIASVLPRTIETKEILRFLEIAVRAAPNSADLWVRLADGLLGERRYEDAEQALRRALALAPARRDALLLLDICARDPQRPR